MSITKLGIAGSEKGKFASRLEPAPPGVDYGFTILPSDSLASSIASQFRARFRHKNYRGRTAQPLNRLPITEMKPWFLDIPNRLRILFAKPKPWKGLVQPLELPDMWADYRPQKASWMNSALAHLMLVAILTVPFYVQGLLNPPVAESTTYEIIDISPYLMQLPGSDKKAGGGGGGGDRSPTPAVQGSIPRFDIMQFTPPQAVLKNLEPELPADPSLLGPPQLRLPAMNLAQLGDPMGPDFGLPSNGPGFGGGIGSGEGTGIGSGRGGGLGPGRGGGTGGGAYSVGGNVSAPVPIYKPEPPYSEEARKAKYQGTVVLLIVVDSQGDVADVSVLKPLGMGLDEKAVSTVRTWKFHPALRNNTPVAVRVSVEITFRLF